jgi:hypothetical protein
MRIHEIIDAVIHMVIHVVVAPSCAVVLVELVIASTPIFELGVGHCGCMFDRRLVIWEDTIVQLNS